MVKYFLISILVHIGIIAIFLYKLPTIESSKLSITTHVIFQKKPIKKNLLPRIAKEESKNEPNPNTKELKKKPLLEKTISKKNTYDDILKNLSQSYSNDVADKKNDEENLMQIDSSYYDEIYTMIKRSFVVPPHLQGSTGNSLQNTIRLKIDQDGKILGLKLDKSSGDEHFDKAVMDGIYKVERFSIPPIYLRSNLKNIGILVDLCPNRCQKK